MINKKYYKKLINGLVYIFFILLAVYSGCSHYQLIDLKKYHSSKCIKDINIVSDDVNFNSFIKYYIESDLSKIGLLCDKNANPSENFGLELTIKLNSNPFYIKKNNIISFDAYLKKESEIVNVVENIELYSNQQPYDAKNISKKILDILIMSSG